jgi:hypothetical protein
MASEVKEKMGYSAANLRVTENALNRRSQRKGSPSKKGARLLKKEGGYQHLI